MLASWQLVSVSLLYVTVLFAVAYWGDSSLRRGAGSKLGPVIYSLTLAVYCSSWTFYGAVGAAGTSGWGYLPIYMGPMLVFIFGYRVLEKIIAVSRRLGITTIADFIASRFTGSNTIGPLVTLGAVVGTVPYIALQLKGVSIGFAAVTGTELGIPGMFADTAFYVGAALAAFSILFGTRRLDSTEHHSGMMLAIAFESLIKLIAFGVAGAAAVWGIFGGIGEMFAEMKSRPETQMFFSDGWMRFNFVTQGILASAAIICLPRQFHVTVVESNSRRDLAVSRWIFPLYLAFFSVLVVPIAAAGLLGGNGIAGDPDLFVVDLSVAMNSKALALVTYLGGFSAATGMVIVATVALSIMVSNSIVMPLLLRYQKDTIDQLPKLDRLLLRVRRATIVLVIGAAYLFYRFLIQPEALAHIGLLSFAAVVQFAPGVVAALYWPRATPRGVLLGLVGGYTVWFYCLLLPVFVRSGWLPEALLSVGPFGISWLNPQALLGVTGVDPLTHGVMWSLCVNVLLLFVVSKKGELTLSGRLQAMAFIGSERETEKGPEEPAHSIVSVSDLEDLASRYVGTERAHNAFDGFARKRNLTFDRNAKAPSEIVGFTERLLSGSIGATSARLILAGVVADHPVDYQDVAGILGPTAKAIQFNQDLLLNTIENVDQGILVLDRNLRVVIWNARYQEMFLYPEGMVYFGRPVADLIRFNAQQGACGEGDIEDHVRKRLAHYRAGTAHVFQRFQADGKVMEMRGNPMPDGGYVTTFSDITEHKRDVDALRESERRVRFYTDNMPAMIAYVDRKLCYQFVNRAYAEALGVERAQIVGRQMQEVMIPEGLLVRSRYIDGALRGKTQRFELEWETPDGTRYMLGAYVPQFNADRTVNGFIALLQDISDRRLAELALEEVNQTLEQRVAARTAELTRANLDLEEARKDAVTANISKTRFFAAASHDLLQPLNAARLFTTALGQRVDVDQSPYQRSVNRIDRSLKSAEALLSALLDISKLDAGGMQVNIATFRLDGLLNALATEYEAIASRSGVELRSVGTRITVKSDMQLLRRIVQNFLSNAVRYTDTGRVLMGCRRRGKAVSIQVWDTGPGIPEEYQERVFEEFQRLENVSPEGEAGLGLGLSIARRIGHVLNHHIALSSWVGCGSLFAVEVPMADTIRDELPPVPQTLPSPAGSLSGREVLVIDNSREILVGMEALLSGWDCRNVSAANLVEVKQYLDEGGSPDVILVDYHLDAGDTGLKLLDTIFKSDSMPPVVLVTADRSDEVRSEAKQFGAEILLKPIRPASLRAVMSKLLS